MLLLLPTVFFTETFQYCSSLFVTVIIFCADAYSDIYKQFPYDSFSNEEEGWWNQSKHFNKINSIYGGSLARSFVFLLFIKSKMLPEKIEIVIFATNVIINYTAQLVIQFRQLRPEG